MAPEEFALAQLVFGNGQGVRAGWLLALYPLRDFRVKTKARFASHTQLIATE